MADEKMTTPKIYDQPTFAADYIMTDATKAVYLGNPHIDNLMMVVYALGTEIWVDRQRNRIVESLLAAKEPVTAEAIEQYIPTAEEKTAWQAEQDAMVHRIYSVLARDTSGHREFLEPRF
jgi:hypothetical protein